MRAVILAGGKGTRLLPYTTVVPKPLLPVGERPILEVLIGQLAKAGVTRIELCIGHLGELIQAYLDASGTVPDGVELRYHFEAEPLGTAGALRQIEDLGEPFIALNGDVLTDLDFAALMRSHQEGEAAMTIATYEKNVDIRFGVTEHDGDAVTGYVEKPSLPYTVSMGIYVYSPQAHKLVPERRIDFPEVVQMLLDAGEPVRAFPFEGAWFDIGTIAEYDRAGEFLTESPELLDLG